MNLKARNILIIKPGAIGDLLQLSPVVRALKERHPDVRITLLVGNAASRDLFRFNPCVDEILIYDKHGSHRSWGAFGRLWLELRRRHFDLVINYQRSNLKGWLLALTFLPFRVLIYHKVKGRVIHAVENHLETVAPLGIDPQKAGQWLELFPGADAEQWADDFIAREGLAGRQLVALNPGASHPVNRWPVEKFRVLADRLSQIPCVTLLLIGGVADRELAGQLQSRREMPLLDLTGVTTLLQLGALLSRCVVVVSGDTGPMHLATAVGSRVVALFGAADPARSGPVGPGHLVVQAAGVDCVPCRRRRCDHVRQLECMEMITVEEIYTAISSMLEDGNDRTGLVGRISTMVTSIRYQHRNNHGQIVTGTCRYPRWQS